AQLGLEPLPGGRGQATLSEFRSRVKVEEALAIADGAAPTAPRSVSTVELLPRPRLIVASRGATLATRRAPSPQARRTVEPSRVDALFNRHETIGRREVETLAAKQARVVLRNLAKLRTSQVEEWTEHRAHAAVVSLGGDPCTCTRIAADDVFDIAYWKRATAEVLDVWLRGAWVASMERVADALDLDLDGFDARVLSALNRRRVQLADQVTETTRRVLDSSLLAVTAEQGWSVDDAAAGIRSVFDDLSDSRARTIARTEVIGGYNEVSYMAARESDVVVGRRWHAALDERTRGSHAQLHGTVVREGEVYPNGLRYPHDPSGPARETVNCRCVELFEVED
ncbi:MAG: phage minor head protein, partial [Phycicoccus sp.]